MDHTNCFSAKWKCACCTSGLKEKVSHLSKVLRVKCKLTRQYGVPRTQKQAEVVPLKSSFPESCIITLRTTEAEDALGWHKLSCGHLLCWYKCLTYLADSLRWSKHLKLLGNGRNAFCFQALADSCCPWERKIKVLYHCPKKASGRVRNSLWPRILYW